MKPRASSRYQRVSASGLKDALRDLAWFRYQLRKFLRFSEMAARESGVTPQQHQLMLGVAGFTGQGRATVSDLAEFLQERHNAIVGLVERAAKRGLVRKEHSPTDRRVVYVSLTPRGAAVLSKLTTLHKEEVGRVRAGMLAGTNATARASGGRRGKTRRASATRK